MLNKQGIVVCLLLLGLAIAQTDFQNTCQSESLIPKLATGLIHLNPLDTYNQGANKDYYQDLTLNAFDAVDVLGYAFALTGFESTCTQSYYTLVVHKVSFENQNTRMRIVVDFRNPQDGLITTWTIVSFTYIVVSRTMSGAYTNIWATVAEIENPNDNTLAAIDAIGAGYQVAPTTCQVFTDPTVSFLQSGTCDKTSAAAADGTLGGDLVVHAYIMGFRWNPDQGVTHYLNLGVKTFTTANPA